MSPRNKLLFRQEGKSFSERVYQLVRQIPRGKVVTYGQIAAKVGNPRAARAVGNALHRNSDRTVPCHRVVNRQGKLALNFGQGGWQEQKKRLLEEGVKFKNKLSVDLTKSQFFNL